MFAIALFASATAASLTVTLAGQIVSEGFIRASRFAKLRTALINRRRVEDDPLEATCYHSCDWNRPLAHREYLDRSRRDQRRPRRFASRTVHDPPFRFCPVRLTSSQWL